MSEVEYIVRPLTAAILTDEVVKLAEIEEEMFEPEEFDGEHYLMIINDEDYTVAPSKEDLEKYFVIESEPDEKGFFKLSLRNIS